MANLFSSLIQTELIFKDTTAPQILPLGEHLKYVLIKNLNYSIFECLLWCESKLWRRKSWTLMKQLITSYENIVFPSYEYYEVKSLQSVTTNTISIAYTTHSIILHFRFYLLFYFWRVNIFFVFNGFLRNKRRIRVLTSLGFT